MTRCVSVRIVSSALALGLVSGSAFADLSEGEQPEPILLDRPAVAPEPEDLPNERVFEAGVQELESGAPSRAIDRFEQLSDRGVVHRDLSFDRGVAYLRRAALPQTKPGDLGQAAAAFAEARRLADDEEASELFESVQEAIATAKLRAGQEPVRVRPSLARAVAGWASENTWAIVSLVGSVLSALGLALWWWTETTATRLAGVIFAVSGGLMALLFASLTGLAAHYRRTSEPAVVVASVARLLDERGNAIATRKGKLDADAAPEGALVYVVAHRGRLVEIEWGDQRAFVQGNELRPLGSH